MSALTHRRVIPTEEDDEMRMSYCIIENTAKDLEEAAGKLREHLEGNKKLSRDEYRHVAMLLEWSQEVVALSGEFDFDELKPD